MRSRSPRSIPSQRGAIRTGYPRHSSTPLHKPVTVSCGWARMTVSSVSMQCSSLNGVLRCRMASCRDKCACCTYPRKENCCWAPAPGWLAACARTVLRRRSWIQQLIPSRMDGMDPCGLGRMQRSGIWRLDRWSRLSNLLAAWVSGSAPERRRTRVDLRSERIIPCRRGTPGGGRNGACTAALRSWWGSGMARSTGQCSSAGAWQPDGGQQSAFALHVNDHDHDHRQCWLYLDRHQRGRCSPHLGCWERSRSALHAQGWPFQRFHPLRF